MKINTAKQKMLRGEPAFGYEAGMGSPLVAEVLSVSGIDFVLVDNQHGSWGPDSTIMAAAAMNAGSATPMARVAFNNYTMIGRMLDEGMLGIIVPMIHTAEAAQAAASACRYPPVGERSWGWARARAYGSDYTDWIGDQLFVAVQIESAEAVKNAEAIMATPGVDGCWAGPGDLAFSLGIHPRDMGKSEEHARALEKVVQACKNTGKIPGIWAGSPEEALKRVAQGFLFVTSGSDGAFLTQSAADGVARLKAGRKG
jgi:4-hydroxy-2-oxoheptanedioate aldolase